MTLIKDKDTTDLMGHTWVRAEGRSICRLVCKNCSTPSGSPKSRRKCKNDRPLTMEDSGLWNRLKNWIGKNNNGDFK